MIPWGWSTVPFYFLQRKGRYSMEEHDFTNEAAKKNDDNSNKDSQKDPLKEIKEWAQAIFTAVILALLIRIFLFEIIMVVGESMIPTLENGDRVFVNKIGYIIGEPQHGDLVIFKTPEDSRTNYVKRLIGLPGDRVMVAEPAYNDFAEEIVPEGTIFVLGDNRNHSKDSRDYHVGFVPMDNLTGKAMWRIWPLDALSSLK